MKINYKQFFEHRKIPESSLYLLVGKPYHLQNEVQFNIEFYLKDEDFDVKTYLIDSDFNLDVIRNNFETLSLFNEKKLLILNVLSNTIPKALLDFILNIQIPKDLKIIIKAGAQTSAFKRNKFYSYIEKNHCIIEIAELKGVILQKWIENKFHKNKVKFTKESLVKILEKNEGNTSAIAQELYKMSLLKLDDVDSYINHIQKSYKYTEYDLIDASLEGDIYKSLKILQYLSMIKSPEPYILFLIHNEIKKIYYLMFDLLPKPFISNYKKDLYNSLIKKFDKDTLEGMLEFCYSIDKSIKLGSNSINVWHQLEVLINSFAMRKSIDNFFSNNISHAN
jgi:DNA polymerase-3 subunit delta